MASNAARALDRARSNWWPNAFDSESVAVGGGGEGVVELDTVVPEADFLRDDDGDLTNLMQDDSSCL